MTLDVMDICTPLPPRNLATSCEETAAYAPPVVETLAKKGPTVVLPIEVILPNASTSKRGSIKEVP